jgi:hypothetical protein
LKSVFHRALPKQRDDLWRELDRSGGIKGDGLKNS